MALTRKLLKGMGLTDEQVDSVIDAHTETVDALKAQMEAYKTDAGKLETVQKELDGLKAGTDWKAAHDKLQAEYDAYKADIASKETLGKVQTAYRALLDGQRIGRDDADLIMAGTKFDGMKLKDDGTLDGAEELTKDIQTKYKRYIPAVDTRGQQPDNPPGGDNGSGANPRAAEIARQYHERRYGKSPEQGTTTDQK